MLENEGAVPTVAATDAGVGAAVSLGPIARCRSAVMRGPANAVATTGTQVNYRVPLDTLLGTVRGGLNGDLQRVTTSP